MENLDEDGAKLFQTWIDFGVRVKELRKARDWTQADLAAKLRELGLDLHQSTIAKLEGATRPTAVHEVWALASVFGVAYSSLLTAPEESDRLLREFEDAMSRAEAARVEAEAAKGAVERATWQLHEAEREVRRLQDLLERRAAADLFNIDRIAEGIEGDHFA